ncbi:hypothetical protein EX30DRAFT_377726 [Ascodesmis nigricans]|uniref:Uncharacterized protein n=1 Tax=Ascodesmis nigricans TaxID=341454 RepID=A0A4S2MWR4_9PEZI|nr:hypothetical protein EX30DRAFT_377726 [Ascodesmis nigricans]
MRDSHTTSLVIPRRERVLVRMVDRKGRRDGEGGGRRGDDEDEEEEEEEEEEGEEEEEEEEEVCTVLHFNVMRSSESAFCSKRENASYGLYTACSPFKIRISSGLPPSPPPPLRVLLIPNVARKRRGCCTRGDGITDPGPPPSNESRQRANPMT